VRDHVSLAFVLVGSGELSIGEGAGLPVHDGTLLARLPFHLRKVSACGPIYLGVISFQHEKYQH